MLEKAIEKRIKDYVESKKGLFIKTTSPSFTGLPDRLMILPGGRMIFVEVKKDTGVLSVRQRRVIQQLEGLGVIVWVVYSFGEFLERWDEYERDTSDTEIL